MKNLRSGAALFSLITSIGVAYAEYPVSLSIDQPNSNGDIPLLSESGWGLTIKMVVEDGDMDGIAKIINWPNKMGGPAGGFGFIVLEDPDRCPWMDDPVWRSWQPPPAGCPPVTDISDETYLEFRPDVDESGMPDNSGDAAELAELVDPAGGDGPEFDSVPLKNNGCQIDTADEDCTQFGPPTGDAVVDGWGYGNDDNLPGLFLWLEAGTGLVYAEPDFERIDPQGVRNLAGMINSVTYDLSDITKTHSKDAGQQGKPTITYTPETRVWAHMNIPRQLVRNVIQYDACVGNVVSPSSELFPAICDGEYDLWRIDGGPIERTPQQFSQASIAAQWKLENTVFTLHSFMVSGHAPDVLFDTDGDGDYTDDAEAEGYTVISNVDSIDLIQLSNQYCLLGEGSAMYADLDGNGESDEPYACPPGPGDVIKPPR